MAKTKWIKNELKPEIKKRSPPILVEMFWTSLSVGAGRAISPTALVLGTEQVYESTKLDDCMAELALVSLTHNISSVLCSCTVLSTPRTQTAEEKSDKSIWLPIKCKVCLWRES